MKFRVLRDLIRNKCSLNVNDGQNFDFISGMPADYVNKLARMFQDIKVSEDLNAQFRTSTTRHDAINIKILNAG